MLAMRCMRSLRRIEQERLLGIPTYLAQKALYTVNTGCRDQELRSLKWECQLAIPQLDTSVF
jgi:hypothetical protein